jgi:hypothetical protein
VKYVTAGFFWSNYTPEDGYIHTQQTHLFAQSHLALKSRNNNGAPLLALALVSPS